MFQTILIGISLVVISSIGYVLFKAWRARAERQEEFQASLKAAAPATVAEPPAPAPVVALTPPAEAPRVITPAGPNPPNALSPSKKVTFSPVATPADPFD